MSSKQESSVVPSDRRQWTRLTVAIPMFVRGKDQNGKAFVEFGTVLNIGAGGALLVSKHNLGIGDGVDLEIPVGFVPEGLMPKFVRQLKARLQWVKRGDRCFLAGVQFADPLADLTGLAKSFLR